MKSPLLRTALSLLLICAVCSGLVAVVYHVTLPATLALEKKAEEEAVLSVFPDAVSLEGRVLSPEGAVEKITAYYEKETDELQGFVAVLQGAGFGGNLRLVAAAGADGKLLGVNVLSHGETPGVGSRVLEGDWLPSLNGKTAPLSENGVDSVSGATVSSRAVMALLDEFLLFVREEVKR